MARVPNIGEYNLSRPGTNGDVIKVENADGDVLLFTPKEARDVLKDYMYTELELHANDTIVQHKSDLQNKIYKEMNLFEEEMDTLIRDRVNGVAENIIGQLINEKIEEEVTKRVNIKLEKLKGLL